MKINIEIPDELITAALAPPVPAADATAPPVGSAAEQPRSGGAAPGTVAVRSIPLASVEQPVSAGSAEQAADVTAVSQQRVTAHNGGAAPG
jgi:hypothetical protein